MTTDEMTIVRTGSGYAVSGGQPYYLQEFKTKRECQQWIDQAAASRAMIAQARAQQAERRASQVSEIDARRKAANDRIVEFVRLGYAGVSLDFRTQVTDAGTFRRCMEAIGGYNRFSGTAAAEAIGGIFGELMSIDVGRESSVVLYLHLPFTAQQRAGSREGCVPIPETEREALERRVMALGRMLHADEISADRFDDRPYKVRLWWD
jgi:hypothetical protein